MMVGHLFSLRQPELLWRGQKNSSSGKAHCQLCSSGTLLYRNSNLYNCRDRMAVFPPPLGGCSSISECDEYRGVGVCRCVCVFLCIYAHAHVDANTCFMHS